MMLYRLGKWVFNNKWKTLCAWLVILVAFICGNVAMGGANFSQNLKVSGLPSTDIQKTLKHEFHQNVNAGTMKVVVQTKQKDGVNDQQIKQKINAASKEVKDKKSNGIKSVATPYDNQGSATSKDMTTGYVNITFKKDAKLVTQSQIKSVEKTFNDKVKGFHNAKVAFTGTVEITPLKLGATPEIIGIIIAFILLLVLFRSFVTAGLPIVSAMVGLLTGILLVMIGSNLFTLVNFAQTLSTMLSLAVGIDYALFILHRYRGELEEYEPAEAIGKALQTAGSSVIFAGLTVMIAIAGLSIFGMAFLTQMALATVVSVAFAIITAVTFLPAMISLCHKFIKPTGVDIEKSSQHPGFFSKPIMKTPVVTAVVAVVILLLAAFPVLHMRLGMPYSGALQKSNTERQAYDMISDKFGEGINAPLVGVAKLDSNKSLAQQQKTVKKITDHIGNMKDTKMVVPVVNQKELAKIKSPQYQAQMKQQITAQVKQETQAQVMAMIQKNPALMSQQQQLAQKVGAKIAKQAQAKVQAEAKAKVVSPISAQISKDHKYALFTLIPKKGSEHPETTNLTQDIKDYSKQIQKTDHTKIILTGTNAVNIDISNKLNNAIPIFATIVIVLAFILLMFMFKSFIIPLIAMIGFGLSLVAALGITTLIFQDGFMSNVLGIGKGAPILSFLPVIIIGIMFGLAMDYEVFMVSRAREEYEKTGDNNHAVQVALKASGPVIVTAALIMMAVFGGFATSSNPTVKSMGLSFAVGIFFDAFLVRLILVPSMMKIFGKLNWIFPGQKNK